MKKLSENSAVTFHKLIKLMKGEQHLKIDNTNEVYIPLTIEFLFETSIAGHPMACYSLSHYYKQSGDLVPDPDMTFYVSQTDETLIIPATFQDAQVYGEGLYQDGDKWFINKTEQEGEAEFADIWLDNIKVQQKID